MKTTTHKTNEAVHKIINTTEAERVKACLDAFDPITRAFILLYGDALRRLKDDEPATDISKTDF